MESGRKRAAVAAAAVSTVVSPLLPPLLLGSQQWLSLRNLTRLRAPELWSRRRRRRRSWKRRWRTGKGSGGVAA